MKTVYSSSPVMTERVHQIKAMLVLPDIQAVYDFGELLRERIGGCKTPLGQEFVIGSFFSGRAEMKDSSV